MVDKRFEDIGLIFLDGYIKDTVTGDVLDGERGVVEKLNALYEEKDKLKSDNKDYVKRYSELFDEYKKNKKENDQLEEAREYYQENFLTMKTERNQFKRENELLKFQLDECRNNKLFSRRELEKENEELKKQLNAFKPIIFEDTNNRGSSILYEKVEE